MTSRKNLSLPCMFAPSASMYLKLQIVFAMISAFALGCAAEDARITVPQGAEMLFWEWQSWETGGGRNRLTIWKDGRSQIVVVPDAYTRRDWKRLRPRPGWLILVEGGGVTFIRQPAYPEEVAREMFRRAFETGIHLLESFSPDYLDGEGTLVGSQIDGQLKQSVIPMFLEKNLGSENHKRFLAVSKILADFDVAAYDSVE